MDKNVLKKFAIESRQELMEKVANKINRYFVDEEFNVNQNGEVYVLVNDKHTLRLTKSEYENRQLLVKRIKEITLEQVIEEAAYTWFNRIIAIRYMEIHDYLPLTKDNQSLGVRVLSSKDNTPDPEIMKISNLINPDLDIEFNKEFYGSIQDNNKRFEYILLLVCKKLGKVIPQVFDGITDYIDILIPDNLLNESGYVTKILNDIHEDNFNKVEIIGWLYQYYNQTEKDRVMSENRAYNKNEIAYVTQLFTPDWIVKYMVENSLGRYCVEHSLEEDFEKDWKYFIKDDLIKKQKNSFNLEEITFIDPCCGSGHILVYAFEVLFNLYKSTGYNIKDISEIILKNNLYGLDIDDRAGQLSILSVILKAREYDINIFNKDIIRNLNIMSISESDGLNYEKIKSLINLNSEEELKYLINTFENAKEYGSLLKVEKKDYNDIKEKIKNDETIFGIELRKKLLPLIKTAEILSNKYDIVVTNPPYDNKFSEKLKNFLAKNYKTSKADLCVAFMENNLVSNNGYLAMINQQSWMFLGTFKDLREKIIKNKTICNMLHLGARAFEEIGGEVVQTTAFILKNEKNSEYNSKYYRLVDIKDAKNKEKEFLNNKDNYEYKKIQNDFLDIPNYNIAYWVNESLINLFSNKKLKDEIEAKSGIMTGDDNKFIKLWYEVNVNSINFNSKNYEALKNKNNKYFPLTRGGLYRKWYGNLESIIYLYNEAYDIKNNGKNYRLRDSNYYFKEGITWTMITSNLSLRYVPTGILFGNGGPTIFASNNILYYLGLLNSKVVNNLITFMNPTMNIVLNDIENIPIIIHQYDKVVDLVQKCINISKEDWDSFETSWNFVNHPLLEYKSGSGYDKDINKWNYRIKDAFESWKTNCDEKFELLKQNEEELNKIFIDTYGLQNELNPDVNDKDITVRKADKEREIKSLISYAVGCMFGRYSLNKEGLVYAGGKFEDTFEKYKRQNLVDEKGQPLPGNNGGWAGISLAEYKYISDEGKEIELSYSPDIDNIIPLTEENYFGDDIVSRFKKFIEVVYGKETLYENLDFIADTLGKRNGENSEETIRRYFINDFYNDHVKMYQKRPIYWLFDSGKKNGFKCLIYMHRYNEGLVSKIRLDYLHRMQNTYEKELKEISDKLNDDLDLASKRELSKKQADISAKLQETNEYDEKIAHIADQKIKIDLDDGVIVNYAKFSVKNPKTGKDESILSKIK